MTGQGPGYPHASVTVIVAPVNDIGSEQVAALTAPRRAAVVLAHTADLVTCHTIMCDDWYLVA